MEDTVLHVISGSHLKPLGEEYRWEDTEEIKVPRGWAILFHSLLVHAGGSYRSPNGRIHLYLRVKGGSTTVEKKFYQVQDNGSKPPTKEPLVCSRRH